MIPGPCALCGFRTYSREWVLPIGTVLRCGNCELVSLVDSVTGALVSCEYEEQYYHRDAHDAVVGYPDYFGGEASARRANADVFAELILSVAPFAVRTLDVGCGGGYLVNALARRGIAAMGIDSSGFAIERARLACAGQFERLAIEDLEKFPAGHFDVVTMMDVIEHLTEPVDSLRTVARLVTPGGTFVILTPRYAGTMLAAQGAAYVHFNVDHVHYFTAETLRTAIDKAFGQTDLVVNGVLEWLETQAIQAGSTFLSKYRNQRDSIIAVVTSMAMSRE